MEHRGFRVREPFSGVSHSVGALLSVVGLAALLVLAAGRPWHTLGFSIYGMSLILLYTASALYHSLFASEPQLTRLMRFDHCSIFLLIAGTYAPVCLLRLQGPVGWGMLLAEYLMAAIGIISVLFFNSKPDWLRVVLSLIMGWLALIALAPLRASLSAPAMAWLVAGGILYTVGTVFYATDRPHLWSGRFSAHDLWHVFVLAGSVCHFLLMLQVASA